MSFTEITYTRDDKVVVIALNRPEKLNALSPTMAAEIRAAMREASDDDDVRVIVLTGNGRGFCAGADMNGLAQKSEAGTMAAPVDEPFDANARIDFQHKQTYFPSVPKPIIAAVNGPCAGLGLVMTLYCDMRFASEKAVFSTAFSRRGLIAEHGISWLLPRLVGHSKAADLLYSARRVEADEALRLGLVDRLYSAETLMSETLAYAHELANLSSPRSVKIIKQQIWNTPFETLAESMKVADREMLLSVGSEDFKEGVRHFLEKRPPAFVGR